jgi:hypothetical protein
MVLLSVSKQQKTIQPRKLEWIVFYIFFGNISILCRHNLIYNLSVLVNGKVKCDDKLTNKKQYQLQNNVKKMQ